jgi:hypothetical protein
MNPNTRIDNPCPMMLSRMKPSEKGFFCKGCAKNVVDFRESTSDQIDEALNADSDLCGVFNHDQLSGQKEVRHGMFYRLAFATLLFLSFLGFSVQPMNAQVNQNAPSKGTKEEVCYVGDTNAKEKARKQERALKKFKRRSFFRRKRHIRGRVVRIGCPSF